MDLAGDKLKKMMSEMNSEVEVGEPEEHPVKLEDYFKGPLHTMDELRALDKKLDDDIDAHLPLVKYLQSKLERQCQVDGACWAMLPALLHRDLAVQLNVTGLGSKVDLTSFEHVWRVFDAAVIGSELVMTPCCDDMDAISNRMKTWTGQWLLMSEACEGTPGPAPKSFRKKNAIPTRTCQC